MKNKHSIKVDKLAQQVGTFYANRQPFRIFHGSTNSTRVLEFNRDEMIDTSDLLDCIGLDINSKIIVVEANMPMDKLVDLTLKHNLIPPVVPEFPGITVGGAIQGGLAKAALLSGDSSVKQ